MGKDSHTPTTERINQVLARLFHRQLTQSLSDVDTALSDWREGRLTPFEAHSVIVNYTTRTAELASRTSYPTEVNVKHVLRDAFDLGVVTKSEFFDLTGMDPEQVQPSPSLEGSQTSKLPNKKQFVEQLLRDGPVLVHLDGRVHGVSVPIQYAGESKLVLRFGYGLSPAIPDLLITGAAVSGTLTFGGVPHHCLIPWAAIYAVVADGQNKGMVWPDDVPNTVFEKPQSTRRPSLQSVPPTPNQKKRSHSRRPKGVDFRGSHLKLVE